MRDADRQRVLSGFRGTDPQAPAPDHRCGGEPGDQDETDGTSTTGTAENQEFVGRVAGDDEGYAGETGAWT